MNVVDDREVMGKQELQTNQRTSPSCQVTSVKGMNSSIRTTMTMNYRSEGKSYLLQTSPMISMLLLQMACNIFSPCGAPDQCPCLESHLQVPRRNARSLPHVTRAPNPYEISSIQRSQIDNRVIPSHIVVPSEEWRALFGTRFKNFRKVSFPPYQF